MPKQFDCSYNNIRDIIFSWEEKRMSEFARLMEKSDECCRRAIEAFKSNDVDMACFWKNASIGFHERAMSLEVK